MKNQPLLTIGIPAYNVELYIEETISSIVKSKYKDEIEILIINDGSKDNTLKIANHLSSKYGCVKVIDKPNGGHGSAINTAIKNATGKYFRLLDGDDWFDTKEFDNYFKKLKTEHADIVFTDLVECYIKSNLNRPVSYYSNLPAFKKIQLDNTEFAEWGPMLPTTTIKTSLLKRFNLKIDEKCFYVDQEYNLMCYLSSKTAIYYPFMIYQYRLEREGQSMQKSSLIKNVKSHEQVCKRLLELYHKNFKKLSNIKKQYIANRMIIPMCHMQYMIAIEWCKSRNNFLSFDNVTSNYPHFYNHPGIAGTLTKFHRKTKGIFIKIDPVIRKLADTINRSNTRKSHFYKNIITVFICIIPIIITNIIIANYINSEQTVYFWDTSAYWKESINLLNTFNESKADGFQTVIGSLNTDYNLLPILPMIPLLSIFGTSRLAFVLIVFNLYVLPFAFFMVMTIRNAFQNKSHTIKKWLYPILFSIFLLSPSILIPVLNGRPDAICILFVSLIFYFIAKTRLHYISNYFVLGFLTFIIIVLRRYFCFWAVSLYIAIFITKTIINIYKYKFNKTLAIKTAKLAIKLGASGILVLLLMLIFSKNLLMRYITGGYSDAYSAYMLGDFFNQIILFMRYYGLLFLALATIGVVIVYTKYRKTTVSELTNIGAISSVLVFLLFTRVQTLGDQHMYMIAPFLTFCIAIVAVKIQFINRYKYLAIIPAVIILYLSLFSFNGTRAINCSNLCFINGISETVRPIVRKDLDNIKELSRDLEQSMSNTDYVYILSSSDVFNDDLLHNLYLPTQQPNYNISGVLHVDKRDGFPAYLFDATYIIVADPIQTHLAEGGQEIISYPAKQILSGNVPNLKLVKKYTLDNDITLKLYYKESKYTDEFLKETKQYFKTKYPNHPSLYETIPETDPQFYK